MRTTTKAWSLGHDEGTEHDASFIIYQINIFDNNYGKTGTSNKTGDFKRKRERPAPPRAWPTHVAADAKSTRAKDTKKTQGKLGYLR